MGAPQARACQNPPEQVLVVALRTAATRTQPEVRHPEVGGKSGPKASSAAALQDPRSKREKRNAKVPSPVAVRRPLAGSVTRRKGSEGRGMTKKEQPMEHKERRGGKGGRRRETTCRPVSNVTEVRRARASLE